MAEYPSAIYTPRAVENAEGVVYDADELTVGFAEDKIDSDAEIVAIQETLGEDPQGDFDTVKERIGALEIEQESGVAIMTALGCPIKAQSLGDNIFLGSTANGPTDRRLTFQAVYIKQEMELTGVYLLQSANGNFTADAFNGVALFSYSAGTLTQIAISTNDGDWWKQGANKVCKVPFTSPITVQAGVYFIGSIYSNSAQVASPTFFQSTANNADPAIIGSLTNSAKVRGYIASQSTISSSYDMSALTTLSQAFQAGVY